MVNETSSANPSLPLHEVLESEFVALHGELPADYPSSTEPETRLKAFWAAVHGLKETRAALCISGGGIRSAIFGLGILQGLARCGLLDRFHYLSTVSGGGYIGSWLSAWIKNHAQGHWRGSCGIARPTRFHSEARTATDSASSGIQQLFGAENRSDLSVDFWTLIATFLRNIFLNWLVLISWLAAAMMIPRLYLAAINLQPDWDAATDYTKYVQIMQFWNFWLNLLLAIGFVLIAVAMAYAIVDVPSTGNARLPQRRFLKFRQLPLMLAALVLAEWWALFRNVHGSEPFRPREWLLKFVAFSVAGYLSGGVLATVFLAFRKSKQKARPSRATGSLLRLGTILLTAAFAGFCLWAIATRMFLERPIQFTLRRDCEATPIPWSKQKMKIPGGTQGVITQIERNYTVEASGRAGHITETILVLWN